MKPSVRLSVILALLQTGLLALGVLAVAASNRLAHELGAPDLRDFLFFINHGWLLLPIPVIWTAMAAGFLTGRSKAVREHAILMSGVTLLVLLGCALTFEILEPWRTPGNGEQALHRSEY
jgi:hypothetical protein